MIGKYFVMILGRLLACLTVLAAWQAAGQEPAGPVHVEDADVLAASRQVVLVVSDSWISTNGWLQRFERLDQAWKPAGNGASVTLGRNGLGWGQGYQPMPQPGPQKKEGDGRSPAGVFLLPYAIGSSPRESMNDLRIPYAQCPASLECVCDTNSTHYNEVADRAANAKPDWTNAVNLLGPQEYRLAVFVAENTMPPVAGDGSCVFLQVAAPSHSPTDGATALPLGDMESLVAWLDHGAQPVLVQLPRAEYAKFQPRWLLPELATNIVTAPKAP